LTALLVCRQRAQSNMLAHNSTVVLSMERSRFLKRNFFLGLIALHWLNKS